MVHEKLETVCELRVKLGMTKFLYSLLQLLEKTNSPDRFDDQDAASLLGRV